MIPLANHDSIDALCFFHHLGCTHGVGILLNETSSTCLGCLNLIHNSGIQFTKGLGMAQTQSWVTFVIQTPFSWWFVHYPIHSSQVGGIRQLGNHNHVKPPGSAPWLPQEVFVRSQILWLKVHSWLSILQQYLCFVDECTCWFSDSVSGKNIGRMGIPYFGWVWLGSVLISHLSWDFPATPQQTPCVAIENRPCVDELSLKILVFDRNL